MATDGKGQLELSNSHFSDGATGMRYCNTYARDSSSQILRSFARVEKNTNLRIM